MKNCATRAASACSWRWRILLYVGFRFQWKFAPRCDPSLVHDAIIVMGVLSFFQVTSDLTVLAAVLAVVGYSLNDTIVIFDRVRELPVLRKADLVENLNISTSQTLSCVPSPPRFPRCWLSPRCCSSAATTCSVLSIALFVGVMAGTHCRSTSPTWY
ncbi:hypothetical protein ACPA9J_13470 [Pseudomonas aeruginosa]